MTAPEFRQRLAALKQVQFREEAEAALCDLYIRSDPNQAALVREELATGTLQIPRTWKNPTDYFRKDLTKLERNLQRLILMGIGTDQHFYREEIRSLASIYHELAIRGVDVGELFEGLACISSAPFADFLRAWLARSPADRSLAAFRLTLELTPDGPEITQRP